jgi:hypothetical protein
MQVPGWWWVISAQSFVDYLDNCPDILELAPQVRCPVLFLRGDREANDVYPGEAFSDAPEGRPNSRSCLTATISIVSVSSRQSA